MPSLGCDEIMALLAKARRQLIELRDLKVDPSGTDRGVEEANLLMAIQLLTQMLCANGENGGSP